jgi:hypothetical protein
VFLLLPAPTVTPPYSPKIKGSTPVAIKTRFTEMFGVEHPIA